jgi:hypothetical protein
MSEDLRRATIEKIEDFLAERVSEVEVARWAVGILTERTFGTGELVLEDAITALAGLHDEDERFDTAREDLLYFRSCLLDETSYLVSKESIVKDTEGMFKIAPYVLKEIAESKELLEMGE